MQRRRKPKAAPANVFAGGQKPKKPKKAPPRVTPPAPLPKVNRKPTPKRPEVVEHQESANTDLIVTEASQEDQDLEVVESQILGTPRRKSQGLKKEVTEVSDDAEEDVSAIDLEVQEALNRAKKRSEEAKLTPKKPISSSKPPPKKRKSSGRGKNKTYQPAARERRLNRARHMEYKYEMKGLLDEISVPEEHRSSLIGSVWAKGERQTASHAIEFVNSKVADGILDEDQASNLIDLIDDYTVRR